MDNEQEFHHELSGWHVRYKAALTFGEVIALCSSLGRIMASNNTTLDGEAFVQLGAILDHLIIECRDNNGNVIPLMNVPFGELMMLLPHVIAEMVASSTAGLPFE